MSSPLNPNFKLWFWIRFGIYKQETEDLPRRVRGRRVQLPRQHQQCPHFGLMMMLEKSPEAMNSLESFPITGTIEADISRPKMIADIFELRDEL